MIDLFAARGRSIAAFLTAGAALAAVLIGYASAETKAAGGGDKFIIATSGDNSETRKTVPITRQPSKGRVVMSMNPSRLPDLEAGDRLVVTSETQVTLDCVTRQPRCTSSPYEYDVALRAHLVLASGAEATGGGNSVRLSADKRHTCLGRYPHREHHCVITFAKAGTRIGSDGTPCPPADCRINVVLSASNPNAGPGDVLVIGGTPPSGEITQDRGRVNAIVLRPGDQPLPRPETTQNRRRAGIPFDEQFRVVFSKRLGGLDAKDGLAAEAESFMEVRHLPHDARASAQLVLADSPGAIRPSAFVRRVVEGGGQMSEANGFNCGKPRSPCRTHKVGVARLVEDARNGQGRPVPLFVNLIMASEAKHDVGFDPNDHAKILPRGGIKVLRFKP